LKKGQRFSLGRGSFLLTAQDWQILWHYIKPKLHSITFPTPFVNFWNQKFQTTQEGNVLLFFNLFKLLHLKLSRCIFSHLLLVSRCWFSLISFSAYSFY
jgi:hypothetical protein